MSRGLILKAGIATVSLSLLLAGCGSSNGGTGPSDKQITLNYWSMWNKGEPQQVVLQKIIDEFQQANPNIHVQVQWAGRQLLPKVQQTLISGDAPDLIDKDEQEIAGSLVKSDQAVAVDNLLNQKVDGENDTISQVIPKTPLHFYDKNGHTYIIPYELITSGIWYNQALLDKYGVKPPQTWDQFIQLSKTLKADGISPIAADGTEPTYNDYWFYWLSDRTLGPGSFLKAVGDKTGQAWSNPGFLQAATDEYQLVKNYMAPGYQGSKWPSGQVAWAQGKAAMLLLGSWAPSETHSYAAQGFEYRMFPFPTINSSVSGPNDVETYMVGWSIPKGAAHVDAAEKFIQFALNKDRIAGISTVAQNLSARMDIPAPKSLQDAQELFKNATAYHAVYDGAQTQYPNYWQSVFEPLDDKLFWGQITPQQFITQMEQQSKNYWSTH